MSKIKIEDIASQLEPLGWKVISSKYINLDTEMEFMCDENHIVLAPWKRLRGNPKCPICEKNKFKTMDSTEIIAKKKGEYRVLGLDQSSHITGWSIFDNKKLISYGIFEAEGEEYERYGKVADWLINMITNWRPDFVMLEGIQMQNNNVVVFQTLARLQGTLLECCREMNIKSDIVPTNTWREFCGVKGRTRVEKKSSMKMIAKDWYDVKLTDDEADAIGIGRYASEKRTPKEVKLFGE